MDGMSENILIDALEARVREHGALVPDGIYAPVMIRGKDALDLLHRLSTNDLRKCREGFPVGTVFTTEKGRIIDRVEVVPFGDTVCLTCHAEAVHRVQEWIEKFVIAEDVEVDRVTPSMTICSVLRAESDPSDSAQPAIEGHDPVLHWRSQFGPYSMLRFLIGSTGPSELVKAFRAAGVGSLTGPEFKALRVAHGIPALPQELNDGRNPLESGLRDDISFTKGCYVGQEVIARLDTYDKVQRELFVLAVSAHGAFVADGAELMAGSGAVGNVTSCGGLMSGPTGELMVMGSIGMGSVRSGDPLVVSTASGPRHARILRAAGNVRSAGGTPA